MIPQSTTSTSSFLKPSSPHFHIEDDTCPWCEQLIPPDKLEEISGKIAARERERTYAIMLEAEQRYAADKAKADAQAKADLEHERRQSAAREATAREEARIAAEATANERLAGAEHMREEQQTAFQSQIEELKSARQLAEQSTLHLQTQLEQQYRDNEATIANIHANNQARETEIRADAQRAADAAVAEAIAAKDQAHAEAQAALLTRVTEADERNIVVENQRAALELQLNDVCAEKDAEIARLNTQATADAARIHREATEAAQLSVRDALAAKETALSEAQAKNVELEGKLSTAGEEYQARLAQEREIMEQAKDLAVNVERAKFFEETQKLTNKVNELQRALEKKSAEELGEGAHLDLLEDLKAEFPDDDITRVPRGTPGADIIHIVKLNGQDCGKIVYDSKNHKQFRSDHVTKLRTDQLAEKAEHAILSSHKLPRDAKQVHVEDGIIVANPARVVALATILRQNLMHTHTLRMSAAERESKTAKLYAFITSEQFAQRLASFDIYTQELSDEQTKEIEWHKKNWERRGKAIRGLERAKGDLSHDIACILGTAECENAILKDET